MDSTTIITKPHNWKDDKFDVESNALAMGQHVNETKPAEEKPQKVNFNSINEMCSLLK